MDEDKYIELVGFTYYNFLEFCKKIGFELSMADAVYARQLGKELEKNMRKANNCDWYIFPPVELISRFFWDRYGIDCNSFKQSLFMTSSEEERDKAWKALGRYIMILRERNELI